MSLAFDPDERLVIVRAEVNGPSGNALVRLALDTGSTSTLVNEGPLLAIGYEPVLAEDRVEVTTGSGVAFAARLTIDKIAALGRTRTSFPVLAYTLPASADIDGLIGLDFCETAS